ncbi:MAG TPA: hypothetical protein VJ826_06990 [Candidatus Polarisedimenticolaceae bacterium]|nr:hypothetical protein [Candidatus Polarisedimenticolaceae bacterium]
MRVHPRLQLGVEWNPLVDEVNPLLNAHLVTETRTRPALIVGTSSDRIGTPSGTAYYATLSKDLSPWLDWPVAPYAGVSYGTFEDRARAIGGVSASLGGRFSSMLIWDGVNAHLSAGVELGRFNVTALLIDLEDPGLSASVRF